MVGKGTKSERETIIRFDEESDTAELWTASMTVYRRMKKRGWFPSEDEERHVVFSFPRRLVRLPLNRPSKSRGKAFLGRKLAVPELEDEIA